MKKHTETRMFPKPVEVFTSDDGKVYENEDQCRAHEFSVKKEKIKNIHCFSVNSGPMTVNIECTWYFVVNEAEYNSVLDYYSTYSSFTTDGGKTTEFPCWVCIKDTEHNAWVDGTLNDYLKSHADLLSTLGQVKFCSSCGNVIHKGNVSYCSECGNAVESVLN